jgi:hypothetical protein
MDINGGGSVPKSSYDTTFPKKKEENGKLL